MRITIEIRAGEGGDDAKTFVGELAQAYVRLADRVG
jgi:protein subunit release factor A